MVTLSPTMALANRDAMPVPIQAPKNEAAHAIIGVSSHPKILATSLRIRTCYARDPPRPLTMTVSALAGR